MSRNALRPRPPYGSMLKGQQPAKATKAPAKTPAAKAAKAKDKKTAKAKKKGRGERDEKHLAAVRRCPCLACGFDNGGAGCGEAHHLRKGAKAGMGQRPSDYRTVPLDHGCHMKEHEGTETFWKAHGFTLDQLETVMDGLKAVSPGIEAMRLVITVARRNGGANDPHYRED